jgi:hypothetical protein
MVVKRRNWLQFTGIPAKGCSIYSGRQGEIAFLGHGFIAIFTLSLAMMEWLGHLEISMPNTSFRILLEGRGDASLRSA